MRVEGPIFTASGPPAWEDATWIGEVQATAPADEKICAGDVIALDAAEGYSKARLMVRDRERVVGFVTVDLRDGSLNREQLAAAVAALPNVPLPSVAAGPAVAARFSVVICTRERPRDVKIALQSVLRQDYAPGFEVVVVDNAPSTSATADVVAELDDERIRVVTEHAPGLSRARNAGVAAARNEWIAFTDDDVVADRRWLQGLSRGFARTAEVHCVTGLVPTGELRTKPQSLFDQRIGWGSSLQPRNYALRTPPADIPYFPFQVGRYGAGANFATLRSIALDIGFDPHLGAGTPARGGEDLDYFFRVIVRGGILTYEPSSVVWHRYRETPEALESQALGYGRGLTAWVSKLVVSPFDLARGLRALMRRESFTLAPFRNYRLPAGAASSDAQPTGVAELMAIEHHALRAGPWSYLGPRFFGR